MGSITSENTIRIVKEKSVKKSVNALTAYWNIGNIIKINLNERGAKNGEDERRNA